MRVIRADDLESGRPRLAERREVIGGLDLKARRAAADVPRAHGILDHLGSPYQQAAAFVGSLFECVGDDLVENGLPDLHSGFLSIQRCSSNRSLNCSSASGLASASLFLTVRPCTTSRTASSTIFPLFVRGMSVT